MSEDNPRMVWDIHQNTWITLDEWNWLNGRLKSEPADEGSDD